MKQVYLVILSLCSVSVQAHDFALNETKVEIAGEAKTGYALTGKVLYTFEKDLKGKSSVCTGTCAEVWPPVLLTKTEAEEMEEHKGEVEIYDLNGVETEKAGFGFILRGKNKSQYQLTFNGWPLYYYAYDRSIDDAYGDEHNENGVDGWYTFTTDFSDHEDHEDHEDHD